METNPNLTIIEQQQAILDFLKAKPLQAWTPLDDIEKGLEGIVHYYEVRQRLPELLQHKLIEFSNFGSSYKITLAGQRYNTN